MAVTAQTFLPKHGQPLTAMTAVLRSENMDKNSMGSQVWWNGDTAETI